MSASPPLLLGYAQVRLERHSERRDDDAFLDGLRADAGARVVILAGETPVLKRFPDGSSSPWFSTGEAQAMGAPTETAFLGSDDAGPIFAHAIDGGLVEPLKAQGFGLADMRTVLMRGFVPPEETSILGMAKSLMAWRQSHRFCARCGGATRVANAGWRLECDGCGAQHFPRTDPVVIMLAHRDGRCLLGRSPRFPQPMYSCLAGFMEPGETIEDAVRRETREETGIVCGDVAYLTSQPWPFPMSLMIGCLAAAENDDIVIDRNELVDARWFPREEARSILEGRHPDGIMCPPSTAIAHHLLRAWVDGAA